MKTEDVRGPEARDLTMHEHFALVRNAFDDLLKAIVDELKPALDGVSRFIEAIKGKPVTDKDALELIERIAKNHEFDAYRVRERKVDFIGIARYREFEDFEINRKNKFLFSMN